MLKEISGSLKNLPLRSWLGFLLAFAFIFVVFLWHLGNLTPGMSPKEVVYSNSSHSWGAIVSQPVDAPHRLIQLGIYKLEPHHPSLLRLASVIFALVFCYAFYRLSTGWFGRSIGLFSTLIFACLPLLVVSARQATGAILFFYPIVFISLYNWLIRTQDHKALAWLSLNLAAALFVFIPGGFAWIVVGFLICRKPIMKIISEVPGWVSGLGLGIFFASIASLVLSSVRHPSVAKHLLLIPAGFVSMLRIFEHIGWMFLSLFIKTGRPDSLIVARLPLLSMLLVALMIFGIYAMWTAAQSKARWLALGIVYAIVAAGVNNDIVMLAMGLPAIIIFAAAGLRYLYIEWRSIFPRNPVPKTFALVLIALVAVTQLYFGLRYALAAWPNTPATKTVYVLK